MGRDPDLDLILRNRDPALRPGESLVPQDNPIDLNHDGNEDVVLRKQLNKPIYDEKSRYVGCAMRTETMPAISFLGPRLFSLTGSKSYIPLATRDFCGPSPNIQESLFAYTNPEQGIDFFNSDLTQAFHVGDFVSLGSNEQTAHWVIQGFQYVVRDLKVSNPVPDVILMSLDDYLRGAGEEGNCDFIVPIDQLKQTFPY